MSSIVCTYLFVIYMCKGPSLRKYPSYHFVCLKYLDIHTANGRRKVAATHMIAP